MNNQKKMGLQHLHLNVHKLQIFQKHFQYYTVFQKRFNTNLENFNIKIRTQKTK